MFQYIRWVVEQVVPMKSGRYALVKWKVEDCSREISGYFDGHFLISRCSYPVNWLIRGISTMQTTP